MNGSIFVVKDLMQKCALDCS